MKKLFTLIILSVVVMVSCSKKETGASGGSMTATINGTTQFTSISVGEVTFSGGGVYQYSFVGNAADSSFIILNVSPISTGMQSFGTGVYSPSLTYKMHGGQYYTSTNQSYTATGPGSINITSSSATQVSGNFNGTLYSSTTNDSVIITNGVFTNCRY